MNVFINKERKSAKELFLFVFLAENAEYCIKLSTERQMLRKQTGKAVTTGCEWLSKDKNLWKK